MSEAKKAMMVSLPGLRWRDLVARVTDQSTPALRDLIAGGAAAPLTPILPAGDPATISFVTGVYPEDHGVCFADEPWTGGVRRATRQALQVAPIWQRLAEQGLSTASVGWPASAPGGSWDGTHVDADALRASGWSWDDWALPLDAAPAEARETIRSLRMHPADVSADQLAGFVPGLAAIDQVRDPRLGMLATTVAKAASVQAIATWLLLERSPDLLCVHQDWLAAISSDKSDPATENNVFGERVWQFLDAMVARLIEIAGRDRLIVLVSAGERGEPGIFVASGPGVPPGTRPRGVGVLDIAPTLLAALGWRDPLLQGVSIPPATDGLADLPPAPLPRNPARNSFQMLALQQRGFAPPPRPRPEWQADRLIRFADMVLARSPLRARDAALRALELLPENAAALSALAAAHVALGEPQPLLDLAERLRAAAPAQRWGDLVAGMRHVMTGDGAAATPFLASAVQAADAPTVRRAGVGYLAIQRFQDAEAAFHRALALDPRTPDPLLGLARALFAQRRLIDAEAAVRQMLERVPDDLEAWVQLSHILQEGGRTIEQAEAEKVVARLRPGG